MLNLIDFKGNEQNIIKQAGRMGREIELPERIVNSPELLFGSDIWLNAFLDLDSNRNLGFGIGPIPFNSIIEYGKFFHFSERQNQDLVYYVRRMDAEYLKKMTNKYGNH